MTLEKIAQELFSLWLLMWIMLIFIGIGLESKLNKVLDAIKKLRNP